MLLAQTFELNEGKQRSLLLLLALTLMDALTQVIVTNPTNSSSSFGGIFVAKSRRNHGRATLADVARAADVTTMTVSRVLRNPTDVAASTAAKVRLAIDTVGYQPNKQAGLLASGRSQIVAALIPNIASSIFSETVQGLIDSLHDQGLELMLAPTGYSVEREEEQLRAVLGWAPAAVVVTGRRHTPQSQAMLAQAARQGTPVIEMWDHPDGEHAGGFVQIGFDHRKVGAMMAAHLVERGHSAMAYVDSGVAEDFRAHERGQGFVEFAARRGIAASIFKAMRLEPLSAGRMMLSKLKQSGLPSALAFANDQLAAGAVLEAQNLGLSIPKDLAILGFGDFPIAAHLAGGISTVRVARYEIGRAAGVHILEALNARSSGSPAASAPSSSPAVGAGPDLTPMLVVRAST